MNNEDLILELLEHIAQITNYIDYTAISKRDSVLSKDDNEYLLKVANIVYSDQQEELEEYFDANEKIIDDRLLEIINRLALLSNINNKEANNVQIKTTLEIRVDDLEKELLELKNRLSSLESEVSIHSPIC